MERVRQGVSSKVQKEVQHSHNLRGIARILLHTSHNPAQIAPGKYSRHFQSRAPPVYSRGIRLPEAARNFQEDPLFPPERLRQCKKAVLFGFLCNEAAAQKNN